MVATVAADKQTSTGLGEKGCYEWEIISGGKKRALKSTFQAFFGTNLFPHKFGWKEIQPPRNFQEYLEECSEIYVLNRKLVSSLSLLLECLHNTECKGGRKIPVNKFIHNRKCFTPLTLSITVFINTVI